MKFYFDYQTTRQFAVLLRNIPAYVERIKAAIAFSYDELLLDTCIKKKIRLEWWGLFNSGISTSIDLIKKSLSSGLITFYPFAEYFHPKVIYFENYGIYIGSANMTNKALYGNVEAGVFINKEEFDSGMEKEIENFFGFLKASSISITSDDVENFDKFAEIIHHERKKIEESNNRIENTFEDMFKHLFLLKPGVRDYENTRIDRENKRKKEFLQEWRETQNCLQIIHKRMEEKCRQPKWVSADANTVIISNQLLHAYYYTYVLKGQDERRVKSTEIVSQCYEGHKRDPLRAVDEAISWWETLDSAPNSEDLHINIWAPVNKKLLEKIILQDLSYEELLTVLSHNYAALMYAQQMKNKYLGLPEDFHTNSEDRISIYCKWLYNQQTKQGLSINETIRYLVKDNGVAVEDKIYNMLYDDKYRIAHFGRSIIGEMIGWGRPDIAHLRNDRVNKGLRCLGFDVQLFAD